MAKRMKANVKANQRKSGMTEAEFRISKSLPRLVQSLLRGAITDANVCRNFANWLIGNVIIRCPGFFGEPELSIPTGQTYDPGKHGTERVTLTLSPAEAEALYVEVTNYAD